MSYTQISSVTLTSNQSSVVLTAIPQTYRDLVLVLNTQPTVSASITALLRFNNDLNNSYYNIVMTRQDSSLRQEQFVSDSIRINSQNVINLSPGSWTNHIFHIFEYSATNKRKTVLGRSGNGELQTTSMGACRWSSNTAITEIQMNLTDGRQLSTGTTVALYGIGA